jgi:hypothetical protein
MCLTMDTVMTGSMSPFMRIETTGKWPRLSSINMMDTTRDVMVCMIPNEIDQDFVCQEIAHGSYHAYCNGRCSFMEFFTQGCLGSVNYCQGGCGYWDDFRNLGPELRNA